METTREVLRIVTVGHVDHGKSTVIGRLLYDTKSIPEGAIEKVKRISKETGKPFEYAYLLDAFEEEQAQGITIDTTQLQFHTDKRDYVIIDAPGHKEFLKNMISGAASAEAALLIIDANEGIQEQSKRHGYILSLLGIEQVYVVVNKMDLIEYSEEKFNNIQKNMNAFLSNLNVRPLKYIPISAFYGENLTSKSDKMPWYKGTTVLEGLDEFSKEQGLEDKPLRFPIQDVYKFDHRRIIAGRVESGRLNVGDEILISPSNKVTKVKSIEYFVEKDKTEVVSAGMSVGITVEDEFFNKRGEFITHKEHAPLVGDLVSANVFWMGKNPLIKNKKYKLKLATQEVECEIASINKVIDATTLASNENSQEVKTNDVAEITIKTKEKICLDKFAQNQTTGRFVIVDGYDVSGGGIVAGIENSQTVATSTLVKENLEFPVECFDDYYFVLPQWKVKQVTANAAAYNIGDDVPVAGVTFSYGKDFDVIDIQNNLAAKIRDEKLVDIITLDEYSYENVPLLNVKGAAINIVSQHEFEVFKTEFVSIATLNHKFVAFSNKWFNFTKNRHIKYIEDLGENSPEYNI
jgi:bifunctional enzyme CysN/CysC/sulfate adenylyltransferase subunit 1